MKKFNPIIKTLLLATLCFAFNACYDDPPTPSSGNSGGGGNTYSVTFWSDFQGSPIAVYVNGSYDGSITKIFSSPPSCGTGGCVTVKFSTTGTFSYTATDGDYTWSGSSTVSSSCKTILLHI